MTLPYERTRAVIWAWEFLHEVIDTKRVPKELKRQASVILRHHPMPYEVMKAAWNERADPRFVGQPIFWVSDDGKDNPLLPYEKGIWHEGTSEPVPLRD